MAARFESNRRITPTLAYDLSANQQDRSGSSVHDVIQGYRRLAMRMDVRNILKQQEEDVRFSWLISGVRQKDTDARREAAVRTIAYGLTLQQLGYLNEASSCFDSLLQRLGLKRDASVVHTLHSVLGEDIGDDALTLFFRLQPAILGTSECGRHLADAFTSLRLKKNKAKFLWRLRVHDLLYGNKFNLDAFLHDYTCLAGQEWANATGNVTMVTMCHGLLRASQRRPGQWDHVLEIAINAAQCAASGVLDPAKESAHLISHSAINGLRNIVEIRHCIAKRRRKRNQGRELAELWYELEKLRRDAHIRSDADGHREVTQISMAIFGRPGLGLSLVGLNLHKRKAEAVLTLERRLDSLRNSVHSL